MQITSESKGEFRPCIQCVCLNYGWRVKNKGELLSFSLSSFSLPLPVFLHLLSCLFSSFLIKRGQKLLLALTGFWLIDLPLLRPARTGRILAVLPLSWDWVWTDLKLVTRETLEQWVGDDGRPVTHTHTEHTSCPVFFGECPPQEKGESYSTDWFILPERAGLLFVSPFPAEFFAPSERVNRFVISQVTELQVASCELVKPSQSAIQSHSVHPQARNFYESQLLSHSGKCSGGPHSTCWVSVSPF